MFRILTQVTLEDLFTTYWSQTILIFFAFGYLVKRIFDTLASKKEINHALFQEYRMKAINNFFTTYSKVERMWEDLPIYRIIDREIIPKEIDEIVFTPIDELRKSILELQIYFSEKEHELFKNILKNILNINGKLSIIWRDYSNEDSSIIKSNIFGGYRDKKLKENNEILNEVIEMVRDTFK